MRKVPIIQEKSEIYHEIEKTEAEKILENVDEDGINSIENQIQISEEDNNNKNNNGLRKIINKIKSLFGIN